MAANIPSCQWTRIDKPKKGTAKKLSGGVCAHRWYLLQMGPMSPRIIHLDVYHVFFMPRQVERPHVDHMDDTKGDININSTQKK